MIKRVDRSKEKYYYSLNYIDSNNKFVGWDNICRGTEYFGICILNSENLQKVYDKTCSIEDQTIGKYDEGSDIFNSILNVSTFDSNVKVFTPTYGTTNGAAIAIPLVPDIKCNDKYYLVFYNFHVPVEYYSHGLIFTNAYDNIIYNGEI